MSHEELQLSQVGIVDTTLREGRQAFCMHLDPIRSLEYARLADALGVDIIEMTHPGSSTRMRQMIDRLSTTHPRAKVATHIRAEPDDVDLALQTKADTLHLYVPTSPAHPEKTPKNIAAALTVLRSLIPVANQRGIDIRASVEHSMSIPIDILRDTYHAFADLGVHRVGLAETVGASWPDEVTNRLATIFSVTPPEMPVEVHLHQDLGLATAKLHAILAQISGNGRQVDFDISLGGYGDRNGILSHGGLLAVLYNLVGPDNLKQRFSIDKYAALVTFFQEHSGLLIPYSDPLSPDSFTHSAGPHVKAMVNGGGYQNIDPKDFGYDSIRLNIGHSVTGTEGILWHITHVLGRETSKANAAKLAAEIREYCAIHGPLTNERLSEFLLERI